MTSAPCRSVKCDGLDGEPAAYREQRRQHLDGQRGRPQPVGGVPLDHPGRDDQQRRDQVERRDPRDVPVDPLVQPAVDDHHDQVADAERHAVPAERLRDGQPHDQEARPCRPASAAAPGSATGCARWPARRTRRTSTTARRRRAAPGTRPSTVTSWDRIPVSWVMAKTKTRSKNSSRVLTRSGGPSRPRAAVSASVSRPRHWARSQAGRDVPAVPAAAHRHRARPARRRGPRGRDVRPRADRVQHPARPPRPGRPRRPVRGARVQQVGADPAGGSPAAGPGALATSRSVTWILSPLTGASG